MRGIGRLLGLVAVGALAVTMLLAAPAHAARDLGGIAWNPAKGNAETLISVTTEGGCPARAEYVAASLFGPGMPKRGQVVFAPSSLGLSHSDPMTLPLSNAFVVYADRNNATLDGEYTLKVRCTDRFGVSTLGEYVTTMTWATPTGATKATRSRFVATNTADVKPVDPPRPDELPIVPTAAPSTAPDASSPTASATTPGGTSTGTASEPAAAAGSGSSDAATSATGATESGGTGSSTGAVLLVVAVVAVVGAAALWFLRTRRSTP